jgi:hypothetical protein
MCRAETPRSAAARNHCAGVFLVPFSVSAWGGGAESVYVQPCLATGGGGTGHWQLKLAETRCSGRAPPFLQQATWAASLVEPLRFARDLAGSTPQQRVPAQAAPTWAPATHTYHPRPHAVRLRQGAGWARNADGPQPIGSSRRRRFRRHRHSIKTRGPRRGMRALRVGAGKQLIG